MSSVGHKNFECRSKLKEAGFRAVPRVGHRNFESEALKEAGFRAVNFNRVVLYLFPMIVAKLFCTK